MALTGLFDQDSDDCAEELVAVNACGDMTEVRLCDNFVQVLLEK